MLSFVTHDILMRVHVDLEAVLVTFLKDTNGVVHKFIVVFAAVMSDESLISLMPSRVIERMKGGYWRTIAHTIAQCPVMPTADRQEDVRDVWRWR